MLTEISINNQKADASTASTTGNSKPKATIHSFDAKRKAQKREEALKQVQAEAKSLSW